MVMKREIFEEYLRRMTLQKSIANVLEHAFPEQQEFIKDKAKQKVLFCTRRSAKSFTAGLYLVREAQYNIKCNCLFIGLTRSSAKAIIWKDILNVINDHYSLNAVFNQSELTMTLPNGSVVSATGVDADANEMKKLLGRKYRLVVIDEASMYTVDLRNLVYGILGPAMVDPSIEGESGTICLMGTASDFPRGLFYDITTFKEKGWKLFQWTAHENPYVAKQWQQALDTIALTRPEYMETPQYKQWYLNKWVVDENKLVYKFNPLKNLTQALPNLSIDNWVYILGIDLGWEDDTAFTLMAYHLFHPFLYVISCFKQKHMDFDVVEKKIREYVDHPLYKPHKFIIDGANKQGVETMRNRSSFPLEPADKRDKVTFIELCNSDLIQGIIKILDTPENNKNLIEEMGALVWVTDGDQIKYPKEEHPRLPNHQCDSFLYGWKCGWHYAFLPEKKTVTLYSKEWYEKQADNIWDRERERYQSEEMWPSEGSLGELG